MISNKLERRQQKAEASDKKPGSKPSKLSSGPKAQDQINMTDEESRIISFAGSGFEQADKALTAVEVSSMLIVSSAVSKA